MDGPSGEKDVGGEVGSMEERFTLTDEVRTVVLRSQAIHPLLPHSKTLSVVFTKDLSDLSPPTRGSRVDGFVPDLQRFVEERETDTPPDTTRIL